MLRIFFPFNLLEHQIYFPFRKILCRSNGRRFSVPITFFLCRMRLQRFLLRPFPMGAVCLPFIMPGEKFGESRKSILEFFRTRESSFGGKDLEGYKKGIFFFFVLVFRKKSTVLPREPEFYSVVLSFNFNGFSKVRNCRNQE